MLILMCGLPFSGKSAVVDILVKHSSPWVIRPEDWLPDDFASKSPDDQKNFRLECWRTALTQVEGAVEEREPTEVVILDCGNSKFAPLRALLRMAKRHGHKRAVLYVNSRVVQCQERAGDQWIGEDVAKSYVRNMRDSLPKFRERCDQLVVIDNTGALDNLEQNTLVAWSKLCPTT